MPWLEVVPNKMPKFLTHRILLPTLVLVAVAIGALLLRALLTPNGAAPHALTTVASGSSAASETPARLAASVLKPTTQELSTIRIIVSRNDTLEHIFRRLALSLSDLASLRSLPGIRAHLDRLRPGETLTLTSRSGSLVGLKRRLNIDQTLQVDRVQAGFTANVLQNPLATRTRTISGSIDSSLFESVSSAGGHDQTALGLADIFGYDIDFVLDIRPGDTFTVTYTEVLQDGKYLQDGPILAARFVNQGKEYLAVRYVGPSGNADYYSPQGRSLHKAFLRAPLEFTRVSSPFNLHRMHPILNTIRAHKGVDYAAPIGTPVRAAADGRVLFAGVRGGYGNLVELDHSRGITTVYGHLSRFAHGLHAGEHVTQGQVIAYVGMTGLATGPHLHYEYRVNGVFKNPQTVKFPEALPIDGPLRADFLAKAAPLLASLNPPPPPTLVSR
ncbi:MAG TPA: peptidoglycan DD-metalloendopeptidase family protein [Steroidobacteraceae bacterium]|jgi:murein DD-endopeptidase MepM/ murein hydrolase activator NlpD